MTYPTQFCHPINFQTRASEHSRTKAGPDEAVRTTYFFYSMYFRWERLAVLLRFQTVIIFAHPLVTTVITDNGQYIVWNINKTGVHGRVMDVFQSSAGPPTVSSHYTFGDRNIAFNDRPHNSAGRSVPSPLLRVPESFRPHPDTSVQLFFFDRTLKIRNAHQMHLDRLEAIGEKFPFFRQQVTIRRFPRWGNYI